MVQLYVGQERWQEVEKKALWTKPIWDRNGSQVNSANALYYAGMAQAAMGRPDDAEASLLSALDTYKKISRRFDLTTVLWELGKLYRSQGEIEKAKDMEAQMRAAALASTTGERARAADDRFYALSLLGCREQWKIRTTMYHCYGLPYDTETALVYAEKAYDQSPTSMHVLAVLAMANYFAGQPDEAVKYMKEAMSKVHDENPTMWNFKYWLDRFEE